MYVHNTLEMTFLNVKGIQFSSLLIYLVRVSHKYTDNVIPVWQSLRNWSLLPLALVCVYLPSAHRQCHSLLEQEEEISNVCSTATQEPPIAIY